MNGRTAKSQQSNAAPTRATKPPMAMPAIAPGESVEPEVAGVVELDVEVVTLDVEELELELTLPDFEELEDVVEDLLELLVIELGG